MNIKKLRLSSGVWVTHPATMKFDHHDEELVNKISSAVSELTRRKVYGVHFNLDREDDEKLYGVNIVLNKNK